MSSPSIPALEHKVIITWDSGVNQKHSTKDVIEKILMMSGYDKSADDRYKLICNKDNAEIIFNDMKDLIFFSHYQQKLQKMGYHMTWNVNKAQESEETHASMSDNDNDDDGDDDDEDDDINLDGINVTPQGPAPLTAPISNITDLVEINSESEDNADTTSHLHLHTGQIAKTSKKQITIKENAKNNNSFIDEVSIKIMHKSSNNDNEQPFSLNNNNNNSNIDDNKQALSLDAVDIPSQDLPNDSFFADFGQNNHKNELEENDVAVRNLFNNNNGLRNARPGNLLSTITAPLQQAPTKSIQKAPGLGIGAGLSGPDRIQYSYSHGVLANNKLAMNPKFRCNSCKNTILASDWTTDNVQQLLYGTKWKHMHCNNNKQDAVYYMDRYVSLNSQYSMGATGSCTINALEATLQLQMGQMPSIELIDKILQLSALYKQDKHSDVDDIYVHVTRYKENLFKLAEIQININDFNQTVMNKLRENISAIITKPPESIFIHNKNGNIYLYDSHPRANGLNGSHFLIFKDKSNVLKYLNKLWPYQYFGDDFKDLRAQQINMCNITLFKLKKNANPSLAPDVKRMGIQLKQIGVTLQEKWHKNYGQSHPINSNNNTGTEHKVDDLDEKTKIYISKLLNEINELKQDNNRLRLQLYEFTKEKKKKKENNTRLFTIKPKKAKENRENKENVFLCMKCNKNRKNEDLFIFSACKCKSCRECALKYFTKSLSKNKWPIHCFVCKNMECDAGDFRIFGNDIHQKYCKLSHNQLLQKEKMQCPQCMKVSIVSEWKKNKKKNEYYQCPAKKCEYKFCSKCGIEYEGLHYKLNCSDAQKIVKQPRRFGKCAGSGCHKLLVNQTFGQQKYDFIVFCQHCKYYNCFGCHKRTKQNEIAAKHAKQHQAHSQRQYKNVYIV